MYGWNALSLVFYSAHGLCLLGVLLLIYHRFRPLKGWVTALSVVRWSIVSLGVLAGGWVAYLAWIADDQWARLIAYASALAFSPIVVAALLALFFKPRR